MKEDKIRTLLYEKLEKDLADKTKWNIDIQSYILELEDFLTNN